MRSCRAGPVSEFPYLAHAVAALAAEVMRRGHHRRDLRFPTHACRVLRDLRDRAVVVLTFDEMKEVQAVSKDEVAGDAIARDRLEHRGPHRPVVLLVALLSAGLQLGVETDLHSVSPILDELARHHAMRPVASWPFSQRSLLAICAAAAARARSGSPAMIAS